MQYGCSGGGGELSTVKAAAGDPASRASAIATIDRAKDATDAGQ